MPEPINPAAIMAEHDPPYLRVLASNDRERDTVGLPSNRVLLVSALESAAKELDRMAGALAAAQRDLAAEREKVRQTVTLAQEWVDCGSLGADHGRELLIRLAGESQ